MNQPDSIDAQRWRLLEDTFHELLQQPPPGRGALAERLCGADAQLLAELQKLLTSFEALHEVAPEHRR